MSGGAALNVVVSADAETAELAADALWVLGATAVVEEIVGDHVELRAALGDDEVLLCTLLDRFPFAWRLEWVDLAVADTWRQFAEPIEVDAGMIIIPQWVDPPATDHGIRLFIEPGATFGLGNHPTTLGSLRLLGRLVREDDTVLDVGTGSGVLAISAVCRGARSAHGTDINPASLGIVALNAGFNGVDGRVTVGMEPLEDLAGPYSIVVANILAPVLIELAEHLVRLTGRTLVISGLLAERYEHVVAALAPLRIATIEHVDGWVAIALER